MAMREYGFMGEPFPSKKFQKVMAEYLGHGDPDQEESKEFKYTPGENPLFDYFYNDATLSEYYELQAQAQAQIDFYKAQVEVFKWKLDQEALDFSRLADRLKPVYITPDTPPPPIMAPEINMPTPPSQDIRDQFNIAGETTVPTGEVIRMGYCPPGFKRVEPEVLPKLSWDELYQENLTLKLALAGATDEIVRLRAQL